MIEREWGSYGGIKVGFRVAATYFNHDGVPPGVYLGSRSFQLVVYSKDGERHYRATYGGQSYLPELPQAAADGSESCTRAELRNRGPSARGDATDLTSTVSKAAGAAFADLRLLPATGILRDLLIKAKTLGFVVRKPSMKALAAKRADNATRSRRNSIDFIDYLLLQQQCGTDREKERIARALATAVHAELERIRHPVDVAAAVEAARPGLEGQLRAALEKPAPEAWLLPPIASDAWLFADGGRPRPSALMPVQAWGSIKRDLPDMSVGDVSDDEFLDALEARMACHELPPCAPQCVPTPSAHAFQRCGGGCPSHAPAPAASGCDASDGYGLSTPNGQRIGGIP